MISVNYIVFSEEPVYSSNSSSINMKSVFVCALILALAQHAFGGVCNTDVIYNSTLITPCLGNDVVVLWPDYSDFSKYYKCVDFGKPVLMNCPQNTFFTYYYQQCTYCKDFLEAPSCETLAKTTDAICVPNPIPTTTTTTTTTTSTTTKKTTTTKTTPGPTTDPIDDTTSAVTATTTKTTKTPATKTTTKLPGVTNPTAPTAPTGSTAPSGMPTPPTVPTPNTDIPAPPGQPITPPTMGTPTLLTTKSAGA